MPLNGQSGSLKRRRTDDASNRKEAVRPGVRDAMWDQRAGPWSRFSWQPRTVF
jgi:hypothetical protein